MISLTLTVTSVQVAETSGDMAMTVVVTRKHTHALVAAVKAGGGTEGQTTLKHRLP